MTNFRIEGVKRSLLNKAMTFCKIFYQMNRFLRNRSTLLITLLQRYEVLCIWIHNIDAICTWVDCLLKFLHRIISSVVDSRRNPLAIRISSVVDWRRIWWAAIHYIIVNMNFNLNLDWEALKKKVNYTTYYKSKYKWFGAFHNWQLIWSKQLPNIFKDSKLYILMKMLT